MHSLIPCAIRRYGNPRHLPPANPQAADVVPGSGGCRKVRRTRQGMGKRGGARVIYFNEVEGRIWLLIVYTKSKFDNLPAEFLARLLPSDSSGNRHIRNTSRVTRRHAPAANPQPLNIPIRVNALPPPGIRAH